MAEAVNRPPCAPVAIGNIDVDSVPTVSGRPDVRGTMLHCKIAGRLPTPVYELFGVCFPHAAETIKV